MNILLSFSKPMPKLMLQQATPKQVALVFTPVITVPVVADTDFLALYLLKRG